jgi:23S rRNA G2445 N2-methylase RlmL
VVRLLVNILDPQEGETVYDPACGTGGMLIEVIEHVKDAGGSPKTLWGKLYGQEKVLATSAIARMNLLLHGVEDFKIVREDTLRNPAFYTGNRLAQFDCVIANPPFSLKAWGEVEWASDKWGRNQLGGVPPKGYADWAWVQHMVKSMATRRPGVSRSCCRRARSSVRAPRPRSAARPRGRQGRGRHRARAEPVLRHRPRCVRADPAPRQAGRQQGQGALHQRRRT